MTYSTSTRKNAINSKIFLCLIYILYSLIGIKNITAGKFTFRFQTNEYSQILFYAMEQDEKDIDEGINRDYELKILDGDNNKYDDDKTPVFIYKKENSVNFEVLDFILASNTENKFQDGIVECGYNLLYFLRLTRDVTEVTNGLNNYQFECMLMTLKSLKAVKNKNTTKMLQALIFDGFFYRKNNFDLIEIVNFFSFEEIDFYMKKNLLSAFLSNLMIRFVFYEDNLIIFAESKEIYDTAIFNEHIPYKNLLINNFEALCRIENILKSLTDGIIFEILLKELNIKSLILNNFLSITNSSMNLSYLLVSKDIFKAVTISNFKIPSLPYILEDILAAIQNHIEFFGLKNILYYHLNLQNLLNEKKLKGLILSKIELTENTYLVSDSTNLYETLEYIDFRYIDLNFTIWNHFFQNMNTNKIILYFNNLYTESIFINELYISKFDPNNVLYLEVKFNFSAISKIFCDSLIHFRNLKTLKLFDFKIHEDIEPVLYNAIYKMRELECLLLSQHCQCTKPYDFLLQNLKIKCLHIKMVSIDNDSLMINFLKSHNSLTNLSLKETKISVLCLKEIFNLENLTHLSLDTIIMNPRVNQKLLDFKSRNIHTLDLSNETLKLIEEVEILGKLNHIVFLRISRCNPSPGYFSKLNDLCSSSLQELTYEYGVLDSNDLDRIGKLELLKKLNILGCKFSGCNFLDLGNNCRFFKSLKILTLWIVDIKIEDFRYLKRFRKLKLLKSDFTQFNLLTLKNCLASLEICRLKFHTMQEDKNYEVFCLYLGECNICVIRSDCK